MENGRYPWVIYTLLTHLLIYLHNGFCHIESFTVILHDNFVLITLLKKND